METKELSKWDFEKLIIAKTTDYGLYLSVEYEGQTYGQAYKQDVSLKEATERFLKFYYPLYLDDDSVDVKMEESQEEINNLRMRLSGLIAILKPSKQTELLKVVNDIINLEIEQEENEKLKTLLEELNETKKQSAYCENHLLNTIIERVEELLLNKVETKISIGF